MAITSHSLQQKFLGQNMQHGKTDYLIYQRQCHGYKVHKLEQKRFPDLICGRYLNSKMLGIKSTSQNEQFLSMDQ